MTHISGFTERNEKFETTFLDENGKGETKTERVKTKRAGKTVQETVGCRPCGPNVCSKRRKTSNQLFFAFESEIAIY